MPDILLFIMFPCNNTTFSNSISVVVSVVVSVVIFDVACIAAT